MLGDGYHIVQHPEREPDGQGIAIASRWPVVAVDAIDLHLTPRSTGFACSAQVAEIDAPDPIGRVLFVNHLPDWQLDREYERELQTVAVARFVEERVGDRPSHVAVAGDLDATPGAASIRFWTGKQSLGGKGVASVALEATPGWWRRWKKGATGLDQSAGPPAPPWSASAQRRGEETYARREAGW